MEIVRLSKPFQCKCGKSIDVFMASHGNTECFDCLLIEDLKEDRDGLNYFLSKAVVKVKNNGKRIIRSKVQKAKPERRNSVLRV